MDNSQFQIFLQLIWCRHSCNFRFFHRRPCPVQSFIVEGLKICIEAGSGSLICTWGYDFLSNNFNTFELILAHIKIMCIVILMKVTCMDREFWKFTNVQFGLTLFYNCASSVLYSLTLQIQ